MGVFWLAMEAAAAAAIMNEGVAITAWLATPPELRSIGAQDSSGSSLFGDSDLFPVDPSLPNRTATPTEL